MFNLASNSVDISKFTEIYTQLSTKETVKRLCSTNLPKRVSLP